MRRFTNKIMTVQTTQKEFNALVVEDNRDLAQLFSNLLKVLGGKTELAFTAETALEKAGAIRPDIVFCDLALPGEMSGIDFARAFRRHAEFHRIPLIAVTGTSYSSESKAAELADFDEVFEKPVKFANILRVLQTFQLC